MWLSGALMGGFQVPGGGARRASDWGVKRGMRPQAYVGLMLTHAYIHMCPLAIGRAWPSSKSSCNLRYIRTLIHGPSDRDAYSIFGKQWQAQVEEKEQLQDNYYLGGTGNTTLLTFRHATLSSCRLGIFTMHGLRRHRHH